MNVIEGLLDKSDYADYSDFININIDGYWLYELLDDLYPNNFYKGLIPTLLFSMEIEEESKIVWQRILPIENSISICPVLMCPDDRDFSCTLVVAEIEHAGNLIKWKRLGLNKSQFYEPAKVGSSVEWFKAFNEMAFDKTNYLRMLETFSKDLLLKQIT